MFAYNQFFCLHISLRCLCNTNSIRIFEQNTVAQSWPVSFPLLPLCTPHKMPSGLSLPNIDTFCSQRAFGIRVDWTQWKLRESAKASNTMKNVEHNNGMGGCFGMYSRWHILNFYPKWYRKQCVYFYIAHIKSNRTRNVLWQNCRVRRFVVFNRINKYLLYVERVCDWNEIRVYPSWYSVVDIVISILFPRFSTTYEILLSESQPYACHVYVLFHRL